MNWPPGWKVTPDGKRVAIDVEVEDFVSALALFDAIGEKAEELEHHPDLHLTQYNRVRIESYSHDVGRLTERDAALTKAISAILVDHGVGAR